MKRHRFLIPLAIAFLLLVVAVPTLGQEPTPIRVKGTETVTGVVIIDITLNGRAYELQCNAGAYRCQPLKSGNYVLVELPKNFGMYECRNVEVYSGNLNNLDKADKLGEYCLIEK